MHEYQLLLAVVVGSFEPQQLLRAASGRQRRETHRTMLWLDVLEKPCELIGRYVPSLPLLPDRV